MKPSDSIQGTTKEMNNGAERRRTRRYPAKGFAEFLTAGSLYRGEIRNFSQTGCLVLTRTRVPLSLSSLVELTFTLSNARFTTLARIVRINEGKSIGFRFVDVEHRIQAQLEALAEAIPES